MPTRICTPGSHRSANPHRGFARRHPTRLGKCELNFIIRNGPTSVVHRQAPGIPNRFARATLSLFTRAHSFAQVQQTRAKRCRRSLPKQPRGRFPNTQASSGHTNLRISKAWPSANTSDCITGANHTTAPTETTRPQWSKRPDNPSIAGPMRPKSSFSSAARNTQGRHPPASPRVCSELAARSACRANKSGSRPAP